MDGPRKDDHLVEPLFAGLEQADAQELKKPVRSPFWRTYRLLGISVAILVWIVLMLVFRD